MGYGDLEVSIREKLSLRKDGVICLTLGLLATTVPSAPFVQNAEKQQLCSSARQRGVRRSGITNIVPQGK